MRDGDILAFVMEHLPDEIRVLRDSIAKAEAERPGYIWERHRDLYDRIKDLKERCGETGHPLVISLAGKPGTRRRWMRNGRDERRACVMCGTEEVGKPATGFIYRFLFRSAEWKFEKLNGHITRSFNDPEWYIETVSIFRQFSFSTEVVLYHAFPARIPPSVLANER